MSSKTTPPLLRVTAGVLHRNGLYLIAKRPQGKHLAGYWEFPGGKIHPGESGPACLKRELAEELGISAEVGELFLAHTHAYPDRTIELFTYWVSCSQTPQAHEHEALDWVKAEELLQRKLSPADIAVAEKLMNSDKSNPGYKS